MKSAKKIRTIIALLWILGLFVSIMAAAVSGMALENSAGDDVAIIAALVSFAVGFVIIWVTTTILQAVAEIVENTYITAQNSALTASGNTNNRGQNSQNNEGR